MDTEGQTIGFTISQNQTHSSWIISYSSNSPIEINERNEEKRKKSQVELQGIFILYLFFINTHQSIQQLVNHLHQGTSITEVLKLKFYPQK